MSTPLYDIELTDRIAEGRDRQTVIAALSRLLGQDTRIVAGLLATGDQIVKHNVDAETGRQYLEALVQAGAYGRLTPASPGQAPPSSDDVETPARNAADRTIRVIITPPRPAEVGFAPIQANRVTGAPNGIDVNRIDTPPIAFKDIALLAAYEDHAAEKIYLLIYKESQKRPYQCDANRVIYTDFPGTKATSVIASLRRFMRHVARHHHALRVDQPTAGFLNGRPPAILEIDRVRYTTMIGAALLAMAAAPVE
jgi:hypothetical protein